MVEIEEDQVCPLCVEELDISDRNFLPCPCGYRVCMWCWHHIKENLNGLCPACRTPYNADPHAFSAIDRAEIVKSQKDKGKKERQKPGEKILSSITKSLPVVGASITTLNRDTSGSVVDRKHLHNYRVVQRNLVYVIGMPASSANEETLRRPEYFGQYGKILKTVIHRNSNISLSTVSVYVTFANKDDAKAAIQAIDGFVLEDHQLRASFGTTKYCNSFVRGVTCSNPECVYLHDFGEDEDRYTKEDIVNPSIAVTAVSPNTNQASKQLNVMAGNGGPSGSGKKPTGEGVLPQPVYSVDVAVNAGNPIAVAAVKSTTAAGVARNASGPTTSWAAAAAAPATSTTPADAALKTSANPTPAEAAPVADKKPNPIAPLVRTNSSGASAILAAIAPRDPALSAAASVPSSTAVPVPASAVRDPVINPNGLIGSDKSKVIAAPASTPAPTAPAASAAVAPATATTTPPAQPSANATFIPQFQYNAYNGFGKCVVFPVPNSCYHLSVWSKVIASASPDLNSNPWAAFTHLSVTDLLELTLPPVDSSGNLPSWPRPLSFYVAPSPAGTAPTQLPRTGSSTGNLVGLQPSVPLLSKSNNSTPNLAALSNGNSFSGNTNAFGVQQGQFLGVAQSNTGKPPFSGGNSVFTSSMRV